MAYDFTVGVCESFMNEMEKQIMEMAKNYAEI